MKTIKYSIVITFCLFANLVKSQNLNNLTSKEFYEDICFETVCLNNLIDTHSQMGDISTLFSLPVSRTTDDDTTKSLNYEVEGFYFSFEGLSESDKDTDYSIAYIWVNDNSKVKIKNSSFGIGDNISKLGNVKILEPGSITFYNVDTNASLYIKYKNDIITEISFVFD